MSVMPSPSLPMARSLGGAVDDLPNMNAYNLFLTQINVANQEAAVDAMKRLSCVAILSGPEVVQNELLPFLNQYVQNENPADELLLILGQQLLSVLAVTKNTITEDVLELLERLAAIEETVVRDQAVVVLGEIVELTGNTHADAMCALCRRLASADWFTAKVSAAGIIPHLIKVVPVTTQHDLLTTFKELSGTDETPMVRRATAKHLGDVLAAAGWPHRDVLSVVVTGLSAINEQDSVRLLAVASLAKAGPTWGEHPNWTIQHWLPVLKEGSTDLSWRVRNHLAKHFSDVATVLGIQGDRRFQDQQTLVMSCFVALLTDAEAEVRAAAVAHVARMIAWGGPTLFTSHMQPLLSALADDVVMEVRSKCAGALMDTAAQKSLDDATVLQHFGPLWEAALQDEFPEVQLQVLTNLHKISALLPALHSVVTTLLSMAKASNWRVRQAVAQLLPFLAEARGAEFFETVLLESAWITLLLDSVAAVRNQIVSGVELLVKVLSPDVVYTTLWPKHLQIFEMGTYLVRSSILGSWIAMAVASDEETELHGQALSRILLTLEQDTVPNVRRRAALGLGKLKLKDTSLLEKISQSDPDPDVCQAAIWALEEQKK